MSGDIYILDEISHHALADNSWAGTLSREAMVTIPNLPSPS
jgi:hypothetical protein